MAGPSRRQADGDEVEAEWLKLIKTTQEVHVKVADKVPLENLPYECNLLAVSNLYDLLVVAGAQDIRIHRLSTFHHSLESAPRDSRPVSEPLGTIALSARPVFIRFAYGDERLIIATTAGIHICNTSSVMDGHMDSAATISTGLPSPMLDILPNPAPVDDDGVARHVAILGNEGVVMLDLLKDTVGQPFGGPATSACWSAKGKQIIIGQPSGTLAAYTPSGLAKTTIAPPDLDDPSYPAFVQWLENDLFLVGYARSDSQPDDPLDVFTISRSKTEVAYTRFFDPINSMGFMGRSGLFRYAALLKQWGGDTKHLAFMMSGIASEVGVMRGTMDGKWEVLLLDETTRAIMPTGDGAGVDDSSCIGMALDLTSQKAVPQGIVNGMDMPDLAPTPRLLLYTQEGYIISFDVRYPEGGAYPGMIQPQLVPAAATSTAEPLQAPATPAKPSVPSPAIASTTTPAAAPPAPSSFGAAPAGASAFGASAFGPSAFGSSTTPKSGSAFGSSAFGASTTPQSQSTFGSSAFGGSSTPKTGSAFGSSAFGKSSTPQGPTTSAIGATPSGGSAFGASAFGKPSTPQGGSAFGSSAFGGASSSSSAFGQSGFGKSAFGTTTSPGSAFGGSTTPSADKAPSAFGQAASTTPAAKPPAALSLEQTTTPASSLGANTQPANSGSTTPSVFGQSAFGQASKPSAFGQSAFGTNKGHSSAFGQSSFGAAHTTGGFAGFGNKPSSGSASGFGGFGQPAAPKPAFGASAFGKVAADSGSAFGGSSAFGTSSVFGTTAASGKGTPAVETKPKEGSQKDSKATEDLINDIMGQADLSDEEEEGGEGEAQDNEDEDAEADGGADQTFVAEDPDEVDDDEAEEEAEGFSLGGFGSALNDPTAAKTSTSHSSMQHSPPSAPAFGIRKPVPGLEDDDDVSPPSSPPVKAKSSFPSQSSTAGTSSSSSYIKPSTAFGASTSTGAFGSAASGTPKTSAFSTTPSSTPSAFSGTSSAFGAGASSTPTKSSTGAPASAFGQSSSMSKTGFGASGFGALGQPKQSAFATTSSPSAASSGFGNISGGFGGFAGKPAGMAPISSTGGFAGFGGAAKGSGSAFGAKSDDAEKGAVKTGGGFSGFGGSGSTGFGGSAGGKSIFDTAKADVEAKPAPSGAADKMEESTPEVSEKGGVAATKDKQSVMEDTGTAEPEPAPMPAGYAVSSASSDSSKTVETVATLADLAKAAEVSLPGVTPLTEDPPEVVKPGTTDATSPTSPKTPASATSSTDDAAENKSDGSVSSDRTEGTGEHITAADAEPDKEDEDDEGELVHHEDADDETVKPPSQESHAEEQTQAAGSRSDDDRQDDATPAHEDTGGEDEDVDAEGSEDQSEDQDESEEEVEELPSITEADEEEEESTAGPEEDIPASDKSKEGLKSPPTWFAKQVPSPAGSPTDTDKPAPKDASSLFSRISPSPAAPADSPAAAAPPSKDTGKLSPTPFSFASPHAVRAASPLGSQPPTNAQKDVSDSVPAMKQEEDTKPAATSLFAPKPVEVKQTFATPATMANVGQFSLSTAETTPKSGLQADAKEKTQPDVKPFAGFGFGQQQSPAPVSTAAKTVPAPTTAAPAEANKAKPFDFSGLGLGKPPASTTAAPELASKQAMGTTRPSYGLSDIPPAFGAAKAPEPVKQASSGFSGFGAPAAVPKPSAFGSTFGGIGTKPSFAPAAAATSFGQAGKSSSPFAQAGPPSSATSPFGSFTTPSGFGTGAVTSQATAPTKTPAAFGMPPTLQAAPPATVAPTKPARVTQTVTPSVPARAPTPAKPVEYFDMPQRSNTPAAPQPTPAGRSGTIGLILDGKVKDLRADIENLKSLIAAASRYHSAFSNSNFIPINQDNIGNHDMLPFDKAGDVSAVISQVIKGLMTDRVEELREERLALDLQALVAKSDVKAHQLEKLAEARDKPSEVYTTTGLDAEQETSQINLRAATAEVEARLMELEAGLRYLRERSQSIDGPESSASEMRKSIRTAEDSIMNRQQTIEDLSRRLNTVRLGSASSPSRQDPASPQSSPYRDFLSPVPNFSRAPRELKVPAKVNEEVKAALSKRSKIQAFAAKKKGNNVRVMPEENVVDHENLVDIDAVSLPKAASTSRGAVEVKHEVEEEVKVKQEAPRVKQEVPEIKQEEPAMPTIDIPIPSSPAPVSFANISFGDMKLNVGQVAPTGHSGGSAPARERSSRRTVQTAPKYVPSASFDKPAAPKSGFSFGFPTTGQSKPTVTAPAAAPSPASDSDAGSPAVYTF